ncbi:hypothetical protein [Natronomonas sp.]|uniref:hypothetical protein n=1 Tax=Natronomonas sp. TaxID=2184060 RepID=UPI00261FAAC8|nr:hypothetical protein [Natronomonas sp.]
MADEDATVAQSTLAGEPMMSKLQTRGMPNPLLTDGVLDLADISKLDLEGITGIDDDKPIIERPTCEAIPALSRLE